METVADQRGGCKIVVVMRMVGSGGGCSEVLSSALELLASQV